MRIVITTSTFPAHADDPVPAFVLEQLKAMKRLDDGLEIDVLIPHHAYGATMPDVVQHPTHRELRYHYAWPRRLEKLSGRGILPALRQNPLRYLLIPFLLLAQRRALSALCRERRPALIYAHWYMPQGVIAQGVSRRTGIPFMFTTHAADVSVLRVLPFARKLIERGLRQAACYTAVSQRTAARLTGFFTDATWQREFADRLTVLPMGTTLPAVDAPSRMVLKGAGVDTQRGTVLALGRLAEKKGFGYLIDAWAALDSSLRQRYQLVIAGDGQLLDALRDRATKLASDVVFTGYASGELKQSLFSVASLFVLPSIVDSGGDSEGLPVALMEALSHGKLVIATDSSGAEELLDGSFGMLVAQKSAPQLTAAMQRMLALPADRAAEQEQAARALAQQFSWPVIAARHLDLMRAATGGAP